jgi:hypothetical protein
MSALSNQRRLEHVAQSLGPLAGEVVFLGGAATGLLIDDAGAPEIRPTLDVDVIFEVATYAAYGEFSQRLQAQGFTPDMSPGAPICRWTHGDTILDAMPTQAGVLGFHNKWYPSALRHARPFALPSGREIRLIDAPHFLATKFAAFADRGGKDYRASADLEDVVAVVDGRAQLGGELDRAPEDVRAYVRGTVRELGELDAFRQAVPGFLPFGPEGRLRYPLLLARWRELAGLPAPPPALRKRRAG